MSFAPSEYPDWGCRRSMLADSGVYDLSLGVPGTYARLWGTYLTCPRPSSAIPVTILLL